MSDGSVSTQAAEETSAAAAPGFANRALADMVAVGAVTHDSARLWVRNARGGRLRIDYRQDAPGSAARSHETETPADTVTDRTAVVTLPPRGETPLQPGARYRYRVVHADGGAVLGEGGFETAPADIDTAPDRFAIAFMSCHQPFCQDGRLERTRTAMLRAAQRCLESHAVKRVLTIGDQMYTDYPVGLSLFEDDYFRSVAPAGCRHVTQCSATQVRRLLQARYRHYWNVEGWRDLHAAYPCYPIVDDHEIIDNWGSDPAHATDEWRAFGAGARAAYGDYQGSRIEDEPEAREDFDYELEYGPLAIYVMDLRSNRRVGDDPRIYSDAQLASLRRFLERHTDKHVLQLVLSVPAVHLPKWGAQLGKTLTRVPNEDFSDRWSTAGHVRDRDRVLCLLHDHQRAHPEQRIMLLSGDIHIACAHRIIWDDGTRPLLQLISSGITNRVGCLIQTASKLSILANRRLTLYGDGLSARVRLLHGRGRKQLNPYTRLNLGIVEFARGLDGRYAARYLVYGRRRESPICVFRSGWL